VPISVPIRGWVRKFGHNEQRDAEMALADAMGSDPC
jgi:hypothetical protein